MWDHVAHQTRPLLRRGAVRAAKPAPSAAQARPVQSPAKRQPVPARGERTRLLPPQREIKTRIETRPDHRHLSGEERVLWDHVASQVKPLHRPGVVRTVATATRTEEVKAAPLKTLAPRLVPAGVAAKPAPAAPALAPLGRRERVRLSRGHKEIEARLDLHGMTQMRAHQVLAEFLRRAHHDGLTFVLVITGKGDRENGERGVLRRQVPQWLSLPEFRSLVVGFEVAHGGHGGEGALYVRIRRPRPTTRC